MNQAKDFLKNSLKKISLAIDAIEIAYEYRKTSGTHIVEVKPLSVFKDSREYIDQEIQLEEEFNKLFPSEELLFISEDSLTKIKSPEFVLKAQFRLNNYKLRSIKSNNIASSTISLQHNVQSTSSKAA